MHKEYIPLATLILLTIISALALTPIRTHADNSASTDIGVNVGLACTLSGGNTSHAVTLNNGSYNDNITGTILHTECNGNGNYTISAIGYTNNTDGNNILDGGTSGIIPTGTTLDGNTSNWAMKLAYASGSGDDKVIQNGYDSFSVIPATSTTVASYNASSSQTTDSTLQTTYGVSISPNQPAGTYTGQVKYTMSHTNFAMPYMQDFTLDLCKYYATTKDAIVYDRRDNSDYTVRYINGACWMTQNLRFTGAELSTATSNVDTDKTIAYGDLTSGNSYDQARIHNSNNTTTGVWYNFAAASAMYVTGDFNNTNSNYDICPKNWHLPTGAAADPSSEFYKLFQSTISKEWIVANDYLATFGAVAGGYYRVGSRLGEIYGRLWSATTDNATDRYGLYYSSSSSRFYSGSYGRHFGFFVRCVRTS